jgi:Ca2+-binding EF-hand superfamily protein
VRISFGFELIGIMSEVVSVHLHDRLRQRNRALALDGHTKFNDVQELIEQAFHLPKGGVVGLWNNEVGAMFPLSILCHIPFCFENGARFELMHKQDDLSIEFTDGLPTEDSSLPSSRSPRSRVEDVTSLTLSEAIEEARHLLGTEEVNIELFSRICRGLCSPESLLTRQQLHTSFRLFQQRIESYQNSAEYKLRQSKFIDLIFDSLKYETLPNSHEVIGVRDVLSMLTVLCTQDFHTNFEIVFRAYDTAGNGYISEYLLLSHLYVVFGFLSNLSQHVREFIATHTHSNGDPRRFAREVWKKLISEDPTLTHTLEDEGILYCKNFVTACESLINSGYGGVLFDRNVDADAFGFHDDTGSAGSLTQRRNILGLCKYRASYVLDLFADIASSDGLISLPQYHRALAKLIERHYNSIGKIERATCDLIICHMFQLFDADHTGFCDMQDLASALVIYCGGDCEDKAHALYNVLSRYSPESQGYHNGLPSISLNRMSNTLSMIFKAAMMLDDGDDGVTLQ